MLPYLNVLKPRETGLLAFIGVAAAFIAARGHPPLGLLGLVLLTVLIAAAGANGLTNYLDRELDALMPRTRRRALPAGRIRPPQKVLPLVIGLSVAGLALAWWLHPFAFGADLVGTAAAVVWRKRVTCVFPQGVLASCAPVLMGWFAVRPAFSLELGLLCLMVA
ncbi:MAG: UbiA family prenyltransferase, partial [Chloroflexota bacterium]